MVSYKEVVSNPEEFYPFQKIVNPEDFAFRDFITVFCDPETGEIPKHCLGSLPRWHRIFMCLISNFDQLSGPTLDIASGRGVLYPAIKRYTPSLLPYAITELKDKPVEIEGEQLTVHKFQCEKERLPLDDKSQGVVLFFDTLEHLVIDPFWTLLEINRVLKDEGHVVISTPNAAGVNRISRILRGINPGTDNEYKPTSIYQRHNREWTLGEVSIALSLLGFKITWLSTFREALVDNDKFVLEKIQGIHAEVQHPDKFGPDVIAIGQKKEHLTLDDDLPDEVRWPPGFYTNFKGYRRRPKVFPIVVGDDYS